MNRDRRDRVRRGVLSYLGRLLREHPLGDNGLYEDANTGEQMADDECEYAKELAEREGMRLIQRAERHEACVRVAEIINARSGSGR